MRTIGLYSLLAASVAFTSCLGDGSTSLTMVNQPGVVQLDPTKVVCVKGGDMISSADFQKSNYEDGDCLLLDYTIDFGAGENSNKGSANGYYTAEIFTKTITDLNKWPLYNTLTNSNIILEDELVVSSVQSRCAYIKGHFFMFTDLNEHPVNQVDSFSLSYDPKQVIGAEGADRVYDLYLRVVKKEEGSGTASSLLVANAYYIEDFVKEAKKTENALGLEELNFKVNYVSGFNKDTTECVFKASNLFTIPIPVKEN